MWVLIATYITAIVRVGVAGSETAARLNAPAEHIHTHERGVGVVAF